MSMVVVGAALAAVLPMSGGDVGTREDLRDRFPSAKAAIEEHWDAFRATREFVPFRPGRGGADLEEEFKAIVALQRASLALPQYAFAETPDNSKSTPCRPFLYNVTQDGYNASTLFIEGNYYIAGQSPQAEELSLFLGLMREAKVTHLVRLTSDIDVAEHKSINYWHGKVTRDGDKEFFDATDKGEPYFVNYYAIDGWGRKDSTSARDLLTLVLRVREDLALARSRGEEPLLLVACTGGVGRTGSFYAALAIVSAIDRVGSSFSIEEIVQNLRQQRARSVAHDNQYEMLHRLAELYLEQKEIS
jgi:hypothetical protein